MARKVKFKARGQKADMDEVFRITLHQRRHDAQGNRLPGFSADAIMAMAPVQRERVKQAGWLGKRRNIR